MPTDSPGVEQTPPDNVNLWTRDFSLITFATVLGAAGGIAGEFAISFFVFDETGSTLASALVIAIQLVPHVFVPLIISPFMDRLPRKAFLVAGDVVCGIAYAALGCWLAFSTFSYVAYLAVSLVLACLEAVDELAWTSIYPEVIPPGTEQKGMRGLMGYMAVTNGIGTGYSPILIAFFRTTPGLSAALYALFSAAECIGRTVGSALQYAVKVPREKRFGICLFVYIFYDLMDAVLLWLPYPLMLANRTACGFLGANSYILRESAMQRYIPEHMRSRVNAFQGAFVMAVCSVCALAVGALGEVLDYRMCMTLCGLAAVTASVLLVWMRRGHVRKIFEAAE